MRPGDPGSSSEAVHDFPDLYKQARFFFSVSPSLSHPLAPKAACRSNGSVFSQAQEGSEDWGGGGGGGWAGGWRPIAGLAKIHVSHVLGCP